MKSCKRCGAGTYRKGGICSTCKPIKQRSGTSAHWTPKQTLTQMAAGNRPKERPVFESEPVSISKTPVGSAFYSHFNFPNASSSEIDRYNKERVFHELNRKAIGEKHRESRTLRAWTNVDSSLRRLK